MFAFPPNAFSSRWVNLLFLYGIWLPLRQRSSKSVEAFRGQMAVLSDTDGFLLVSDNCSITVPRAKRLRLMYLPSTSLSASDTAFSLPARSIRVCVQTECQSDYLSCRCDMVLTNLDRRTSTPSRLSIVFKQFGMSDGIVSKNTQSHNIPA